MSKITIEQFIKSCVEGDNEAIKCYISQMDCDINGVANINNVDYTALMIACKQPNFSLAALLLEQEEIAVNLKNSKGISALHLACKKGHIKIVHLLLKRDDIEVNVVDGLGNTPLMFAAKNGHLHVVEQLIEQDVNVEAKNREGETAYALAIKEGYTKTGKLLKFAAESTSPQDNTFNGVYEEGFLQGIKSEIEDVHFSIVTPYSEEGSDHLAHTFIKPSMPVSENVFEEEKREIKPIEIKPMEIKPVEIKIQENIIIEKGIEEKPLAESISIEKPHDFDFLKEDEELEVKVHESFNDKIEDEFKLKTHDNYVFEDENKSENTHFQEKSVFELIEEKKKKKSAETVDTPSKVEKVNSKDNEKSFFDKIEERKMSTPSTHSGNVTGLPKEQKNFFKQNSEDTTTMNDYIRKPSGGGKKLLLIIAALILIIVVAVFVKVKFLSGSSDTDTVYKSVASYSSGADTAENISGSGVVSGSSMAHDVSGGGTAHDALAKGENEAVKPQVTTGDTNSTLSNTTNKNSTSKK